MSGCDHERLHALHDDALPATAREELLRHVAGCDECARVQAEWSALDALAAEPPVAPAGYFEALPARLAARASATPRPRALWSRPATWATALAAALLVAVVTPRLLQEPDAAGRVGPARAERASAAPLVTPAPAATPVVTADRRQPEPPQVARDKRLARAAVVPPAATSASPERQPGELAAPAAPPVEQRQADMAKAENPVAIAEAATSDAARTPAFAETAAVTAGAEAAASQPGPARADAAPAPQAMQKSAAAPRAAALAASAATATAAGGEGLVRARAERDRLVEEARRPGALPAASRRAFDAAAAVVRAGGDTADREALARIGADYLATVSAEEERRRARAVLEELGPRPR